MIIYDLFDRHHHLRIPVSRHRLCQLTTKGTITTIITTVKAMTTVINSRLVIAV